MAPRWLLVSLVLSVCVLLAVTGASAADKESVPRPEWSIGDWWEFVNGPNSWRLTVIARERDHYVLARSARGTSVRDGRNRATFHADLDGWITKNITADGKVSDAGDKREWVKFPLAVGGRWFFSVMTTLVGGPAGQLQPVDYEAQAMAWETIDVGGRSMRALKIVYAQRVRTQSFRGQYGEGITGWYVPEAKRLVRLRSDYTGGPTLEMVAFETQGDTGPAVSSPSATPPPRPIAVEFTGIPDAVIQVGGQQYRTAGNGAVTVNLPPGEHEVTATRDGFEPWRSVVTLDGRQSRVTHRFNMTPLKPPTITETPPPPRLTQPVAPPRPEPKAPLIVLNYPAADLTVERDQIVVVGLVTAEAGIATVQVTVNGAVVTPRDIKASGRGAPIRATVSLVPGENVIEVTATDSVGSMAQVVRTVTRVTADKDAGVAARSPNRFAVVIGVGRYENARIPRLHYSVSDAEAVARTLTDVAGFKKEHVLLLTDKTERKPTLRNIKWALGNVLTRQARKDDTVVIFFAGHGAPEIDPRGLKRDGLAKYLIPIDADPDDLYSTALPMDELHTIFNRIESERIVALLDACYSGAGGGRTFAAQRTRAVGIDDVFLDRLTRSKGRVIITASRSTEVSLELPELGHGLFTYHLLQALAGAADLNQDGIVSLQELYEYVQQRVSEKSRAVGANQHPVMKGEMEGSLPLTVVRRR